MHNITTIGTCKPAVLVFFTFLPAIHRSIRENQQTVAIVFFSLKSLNKLGFDRNKQKIVKGHEGHVCFQSEKKDGNPAYYTFTTHPHQCLPIPLLCCRKQRIS